MRLARPAFARRAYLPAATWAALIWLASSFDWGRSPWRHDGLGLLGAALSWLFEALPAAIAPDQFIHALVYAVLAAALRAPSRLPPPRAGLVAIALATTWGAIDELHQHFVPGRVMDARDLAADAIGACLGVAAVLVARRLTVAVLGARGGPALR